LIRHRYPQRAGKVETGAALIAMLEALEHQAAAAGLLAGTVERRVKAQSFTSFLTFRQKIDEFRALIVILEGRLEPGRADHLGSQVGLVRQQLVQLDVHVLCLLVRVVRDFFTTLATSRVLPLGAREIFEPELGRLVETRQRLEQPPCCDQIGPEVLADLDQAMTALTTVIERTPALPDFSEAAGGDDAPGPIPGLLALEAFNQSFPALAGEAGSPQAGEWLDAVLFESDHP